MILIFSKISILVVVGLLLTSCFEKGEQAHTSKVHSAGDNKVTGSELIGGSFELTNHHGKRVSDKSFNDKYKLVFFGFTHCPNICPIGLMTISRIMKKLKSDGVQLHVLFITVDPERDSAERIAAYLKNFNSDIQGLSGSVEEIKSVAKNYRAYFSKIKQPNHDAHSDHKGHVYTIDHTSLIYFMDKENKFVDHFSSSGQEDETVEKIKKYIN